MADFSNIIQEINEEIKQNGANEITGAKLNEVLRDMIAAVNNEKQDTLMIDATPTEDSTNPVQSGGVFDVLADLIAENALFGGLVGPESQPWQGADHRYFYLAIDAGTYVNFNNLEVYGPSLIRWNLDFWGIVTLWTSEEDLTASFELKADKVSGATEGNLAGLDYEGNLTDSGKSPSDFATAAQGAKADTAYQKPASGIPKNDLASGVQTSLGKADTAYQMPTGGIPASDLASAVQTSLGKADTAIQDVSGKADKVVGATSGDVATLDSNGNLTDSGLSVFDFFVMVEDASTPPASMAPNTVYKYGTLSGNTTFPALATPTEPDIANVYCWTFTTPATAPTITWPVAITSWAGGSAPTINASKSYEVSVMDGFATIIEN